MSLKDIETKVETEAKSFWARNKAHVIMYPVTALVGAVIQHLLGKML